MNDRQARPLDPTDLVGKLKNILSKCDKIIDILT